MAGKSDQLKVQNIPTMSDLQRQVLDSMLSGFIPMMDKTKFGEAYPGAGVGAYSPEVFKYKKQEPTYKNNPMPEGGKNFETCKQQCREDFPDDKTRQQECIQECRKKWLKKKEETDKSGMAESGGGQSPFIDRDAFSAQGGAGAGPNAWSGLFNANVALPQLGGMGGGMLQPLGTANNPMTQALVGPMSNPLTQNLTGNFPQGPGMIQQPLNPYTQQKQQGRWY
jgi:hypothetical protein